MKTTTLSALSEPNRLLIVELLRNGPLSVGEIADRLKFQQPQASKHLKVLADAGLVEVSRIAQRRIYQLRPEPLQELDAWLNKFRNEWDDKFDGLSEYLAELQKGERKPDRL
ncbi:ArsR/SmtB family transcription factor [Paenibacillus koleovorans]|uniref:ArsR/SmtB family transcription factor n=1 Tax=Paenibacillus koleovorans TaxID=121608 RepID=UPI000FD9EB6A|nr:metalloregulator ArsR/SmtB family transcription factor [Paenibacillus koleovorans]